DQSLLAIDHARDAEAHSLHLGEGHPRRAAGRLRGAEHCLRDLRRLLREQAVFLLSEHVTRGIDHRGANAHAAQIDAELELVSLHGTAAMLAGLRPLARVRPALCGSPALSLRSDAR